jgi:hypothetical protein
VSAPELYEKISSLLDLWTVKARASSGRPFQADQDIYMWALDLTMAVAFGFPKKDTMMVKQIIHLENHSQANSETPMDVPFEFSNVPLDPELNACIYLANSVGVAFQSPVPRLAHYLYLRKSYSREQTAIKQEFIRQNIEKSLKRLEMRGPEKKLTCAVDQILLREKERSEKCGIQPNFFKPAIYDEVRHTSFFIRDIHRL